MPWPCAARSAEQSGGTMRRTWSAIFIGLGAAAKLAVAAPYPNPRKVEYAPVLELLRNAYEGRRPS